ncbi:hypothetical protein PUMCH_001389 [Australozyma saopauloensis]|uniref:Calcium permeable stress-gated cation channel 1 n=1 Tax=Australozyma saopauloensis TaxID=291208 RepID=A0AAX4H6C0_9ASCO|nr:hypothetical protein PUMCH_001389 [[Candida] saopauloensis]
MPFPLTLFLLNDIQFDTASHLICSRDQIPLSHFSEAIKPKLHRHMSLYNATNGTKPIFDPIGGHNGYRVGARIARVQIALALFLGVSAFMLFCMLRKRYPRIYVANFNRANQNYFHSFSRRNLPRLPALLFGWVPIVYKINEEQVLEHAGLDAVVFLGFFKMCIKTLAVCVLFAYTVLSPVRYWFTGRVDFPGEGEDNDELMNFFFGSFLKRKHKHSFEQFLWMYTVFTYVFTFVLLYFLYRQTLKIIDMRQHYLGKQSSITDRTIKILGIPPVLRDEELLKRHINSLGVGEVDSVCVVKEWNVLNDLFSLRKHLLYQLESLWVEFFTLNKIQNLSELAPSDLRLSVGEDIRMSDGTAGSSTTSPRYRDSQSPEGSPEGSPDSGPNSETASVVTSASCIDIVTEHLARSVLANNDSEPSLIIDESLKRPKMRKGWFGVCGPKVDKIDYYNQKLLVVDKEIKRYRKRDFPPSSTAFITMRSVAQAQMLAQAVLDPKVNHLITNLAPAPHDIIWKNLCLSRNERNTRIFLVMTLIGLISVLLVIPVRFLTNFLNIKSISRVSPGLARFLKDHKWAENIITGILPPYVFTIFNIVMPYVYIWFTKRQGYTSRGDEELSAISKNFFYIFVNLFLVFTLFGTAILTDTAQLAYQLADSLKKLSLFYVDLIILQGIGIFPYKLLLLGNLLKWPLGSLIWCKTPRDYFNLHKPPVFNFGLQLPQPILILIITITYSVISTKIVTAGLIYFIIGYFVFKYQLLYACVHPPHNTGKVWPLVVRRVILGLLIFHTMMVGTLTAERAYTCATVILPMPVFTMYIFWYFHKHYIPLSSFIALRSIENNELPYHGDEERGLYGSTSRAQTLDEEREFNQSYVYPNLVSDLDGPLVAVDNSEVLFIGADGSSTRKRIPIFQ